MPIARWFAIAVIASLLGVAVPSGWAQLETTKILFESTRDGDSEIYVMDVDGANPTNLIQSPTSEDVNPEWSADGTRVAFASDRSGNMDIWVMDADGGNLERITTHAASDTKPTWRPDGSEIAFVSDRDGDLEIHVVDVVTKAAENRTLSPGYSETDPDWASDGTEILFASDRNGTFDIHRMDTASFATTPVAVLAGYHEVAPTLSYDGAQIAYDRYQVGGNPDVVAGLYTVGFDGSNPMPRAAYGGDRNPSWAPDGSKIAYELSGSIMTVDTDAAGIKTTLTTGGFDANPSWSVALPQVTVSVSPLSVDLADVEVGSSGAATFTITSAGTATLTISDIASDDAAFTVAPNTGTPPFDLTSGESESETVTVTFTPTVEGAQTASVTITHNAAGSPSVVTATGTGTALSGPPPDAVTVIDAQGALASLVSIPIEIYDVTGLGVVGVAMSLTYRSDILTPTSTAGDTTAVTVDSGVVPASWTLEQNTELIDATTSQLNFSMAGDFADPLAGPGTLVDIAFDVTATAPGDPLGTTYPLQLTNVQLNEGMASSTPVHGSFIVLEFVYGDVTGNGAAGAYDAAWVLEHVANAMLAPPVEVPFPIEETAPVWASLPLSHADAHDVADVDGDGDITALDASLILQKEVSRIDVFPVEEPPAAPIVDAGGFPYRLLSGAESARPGGTITVSLDASDAAELYSGELRLDFDGSLLTPVDVSLRSTSSASEVSRPLLVQRVGEGQVAIVFASARPMESSDALLEVTFEASRAITEPTESVIRATHLRLNRSLIDSGFVYRYRVEPYRNQLLANYPNPFNPETWIPFELAADADVTIRIYDLAGGRIRTLELGALATGEYVGRERAAYWDGKNAQGERVASGVYVYELAAGGYRSLRRMVVMK